MKDVEPQKLIQTIHDVLNNKRIIHPEAQSVIETVSSNLITLISYLNEK